MSNLIFSLNSTLPIFIVIIIGYVLGQKKFLTKEFCSVADKLVFRVGLINRETISKMKDGVILVNTSRGALVKTDDLIEGIRAHKFFGVGLDVYEEETPNVFEDRSDEILEHSVTARLLSFPDVMITSHQGFFTSEALAAIAQTTLQNIRFYENGEETPNEVK